MEGITFGSESFTSLVDLPKAQSDLYWAKVAHRATFVALSAIAIGLIVGTCFINPIFTVLTVAAFVHPSSLKGVNTLFMGPRKKAVLIAEKAFRLTQKAYEIHDTLLDKDIGEIERSLRLSPGTISSEHSYMILTSSRADERLRGDHAVDRIRRISSRILAHRSLAQDARETRKCLRAEALELRASLEELSVHSESEKYQKTLAKAAMKESEAYEIEQTEIIPSTIIAAYFLALATGREVPPSIQETGTFINHPFETRRLLESSVYFSVKNRKENLTKKEILNVSPLDLAGKLAV